MSEHQQISIKHLGSLLEHPLETQAEPAMYCPVCQQALEQQKCKVICRSERCIYRIIYNCSEF